MYGATKAGIPPYNISYKMDYNLKTPEATPDVVEVQVCMLGCEGPAKIQACRQSCKVRAENRPAAHFFQPELHRTFMV